MLKLGIIGLHRGSRYIERIGLVKNAYVEAVCDIDREKAECIAKQYGVKNVFYDYRDLIKSDVDAVIVASPINLHAQHVVDTLKAGKHVLSEVITATTVEDCERIVVSFGASWPMNVIKSYKARTAKGKSVVFLYLIFFGYIAGILSKLVNADYMAHIGQKWYVLFFYVLNFVMVGADLCLYYR